MSTAAGLGAAGRARGIRHGIVVVPELRWREASPRWSAAEELGFDHAWTYDHLVWGGLPDSPVFAFAPTLALASTVTSTIGLGVFVASPNFRHPYVLARDAITLDDASGGRFLLGVGAGGDLDSRILGEDRPLKQRVDRFHEFTGLLDRLLRDDHVDHDGEFYATRDARTLPEPVRDRVPLVVAGNGPRSVALAARLGDAWATYGGKGDTVDEWFDHVAGLVSALRRRVRPVRPRAARPLPPARRLAALRPGVGRPLRRDGRARGRARLHRRRHPLAAAGRARTPVTRPCSRPSPRRSSPLTDASPHDRRSVRPGRGPPAGRSSAGSSRRRAPRVIPTAAAAFASPWSSIDPFPSASAVSRPAERATWSGPTYQSW